MTYIDNLMYEVSLVLMRLIIWGMAKIAIQIPAINPNISQIDINLNIDILIVKDLSKLAW